MFLLSKIWNQKKKIILAGALVLSVNAVSIPITSYINNNLDSEKQTVVFTSGYTSINLPPKMISGLIDFFMYPPITIRQNLKGNKVVWLSNSTRKEVLDALQDPQYKNIIFIGHGSDSCYAATDGNVTVDTLVKLNLPRRHGEFIQHTCGGEVKNKSLREVLYPDGSEGYNFDRTIEIFENYGKSLVELLFELVPSVGWCENKWHNNYKMPKSYNPLIPVTRLNSFDSYPVDALADKAFKYSFDLNSTGHPEPKKPKKTNQNYKGPRNYRHQRR